MSARAKGRIACFHLLNNYSGSPNVLAGVVEGLLAHGYEVDLFTSRGPGHLSGIRGARYHHLAYSWHRSRKLTAARYCFAQAQLLLAPLLTYRSDEDVLFYVNTQAPLAAALAGWASGRQVLYHLHEHYIVKDPLKRLAKLVKERTAAKAICVSQYLVDQEATATGVVIYNSLSDDFFERAKAGRKKKSGKARRCVLQISALRNYKGIGQFAEVARRLPQYDFILVADASAKEVAEYAVAVRAPFNMRVFSTQRDVHPFYRDADILVNMTLPDLCRESFGMTILEGMAYGLPAIVPPAGGPLELVDEEKNGYRVDPYAIGTVAEKIDFLLTHDSVYSEMSRRAREKAERFDRERQVAAIVGEIEAMRSADRWSAGGIPR